VRVTAKGQVPIPVEIRERFGFLPDTEVMFVVDKDAVRLVRADAPGRSRGDRVVAWHGPRRPVGALGPRERHGPAHVPLACRSEATRDHGS
jgi:antitoxin PrlF